MTRPTDWYVLDLAADPVPGDPDVVSSVARRWGQVADDADTARAQVQSLLGDEAVMEWIGKAGDAFRSHSSKLPGQLSKCADSYRQASAALSSWSMQLGSCQDQADRALALGRQARADLASASGQLGAAQANASSAAASVSGYVQAARQHAADSSEAAPDPAAVRAATARSASADQAVAAARAQVADAQSRLDAAKRMAADAASLRDQHGSTTSKALHDAADAGIPPDSFWSKLGGALSHVWHAVVQIAKVVVAIGAIVAIIVGGPLVWVVVAAGAIVLADTLIKYSQGKASLLDVGLSALACIPAAGEFGAVGEAGELGAEANAVRSGAEDTSTVVRDIDDVEGGTGVTGADPVWRTSHEPLYRSDSRTPDEIFRDGFQPRDPTNTDLPDFVRNNTPSNFVSTSRDPDLYRQWYEQFGTKYRYTIEQPGGIDVNATLPDNIYANESEIAFPGGLPAHSVAGAHPVTPDGGLGEWIPNPNYIESMP